MMLLNIFVTIRVDSMMLLEEGFEVVSVDASDKMLKQAYKTRWERRKEEIYDKWGENNAEATFQFLPMVLFQVFFSHPKQ